MGEPWSQASSAEATRESRGRKRLEFAQRGSAHHLEISVTGRIVERGVAIAEESLRQGCASALLFPQGFDGCFFSSSHPLTVMCEDVHSPDDPSPSSNVAACNTRRGPGNHLRLGILITGGKASIPR